MASSVILFLIFPLIIFSSSSSPTLPSSPDLIRRVCFDTVFDLHLNAACLKTLLSNAKIASAKNMHDLAFAITEAGYANTTGTEAYIEKVIGNPGKSLDPKVRDAFRRCNTSYDSVTKSFKIVATEIDEDPLSASYDMKIAFTDQLQPCLEAVGNAKVEDRILLSGNTGSIVFGGSAFVAISQL